MRMRRKTNLIKRYVACGDICLCWIQDYAMEKRGENPMQLFDYEKIFGNKNPVHIEIGCGKGKFIIEKAKINPDINFLALEQCQNVIVSAMEAALKENLPNLKFITGMAEYLEKVIPKKSIQKIYLNFSCPFPKYTYAKHRLTHKVFLDIYKNILSENGSVIQKTDNMKLFEFSIESFSQNNFIIKNISLDLHNSGIEGNIKTEYEQRFSDLGLPIYYLETEFK